jgi:hypothetical protein
MENSNREKATHITKEEYKEILEKEKRGELVLYIDTVSFKNFLSSISSEDSIKAFREDLSRERSIIALFPFLEFLFLIVGIVSSIFLFKWYSILIIVGLLIFWSLVKSRASFGKHEIISPVLLLLVTLIILFVPLYEVPNIWGYIWPLSVCLMYLTSKSFYYFISKIVFSILHRNYFFFDFFYKHKSLYYPPEVDIDFLWTEEKEKINRKGNSKEKKGQKKEKEFVYKEYFDLEDGKENIEFDNYSGRFNPLDSDYFVYKIEDKRNGQKILKFSFDGRLGRWEGDAHYLLQIKYLGTMVCDEIQDFTKKEYTGDNVFFDIRKDPLDNAKILEIENDEVGKVSIKCKKLYARDLIPYTQMGDGKWKKLEDVERNSQSENQEKLLDEKVAQMQKEYKQITPQLLQRKLEIDYKKAIEIFNKINNK